MPITYTSSEQVEVYRFSIPVTVIVPVTALFLQAWLPRQFPFFSMFDLPLLVTIFFAVSRRNPISGLLTGAMTPERIAALPADDWRKHHPDFQEPGLHRNLMLVRLLRTIGKRRGFTPAEVAVAWVLYNPAVTGAIVGARRPGQVRGVLGAAELRLSPREVAEIETFFAKQAA